MFQTKVVRGTNNDTINLKKNQFFEII